jgi:hypothetical protein
VSLVQVLRDGVAGVEGLDIPFVAVVSPDGRHVYVENPSGLAQFGRDAGAGALTFQQEYTDGIDGWPVLGFVVGIFVQVSPDGEHLYVGGVTASRDADSGNLAFVNDEGRTHTFVAVSADSKFVYGNPVRDILVYDRGFSGCDPLPRVACDTAAKTKLTLKDSAAATRQKLVWSWTNGAPADIADFDPMDVKHYGVCQYEAAGV